MIDRCTHTWRDHLIGHTHGCGYTGGHVTTVHQCWCGATRIDREPTESGE